MSIIDRMRKEDAVYWKATAKDRNGNYVLELPVEIKVRWEDSFEVEDGQTPEVVYDAMIYVGEDIPVGSRLMLGTLADLSTPMPPPSQAKQVKKFEQIKNLRATKTLRWVYL